MGQRTDDPETPPASQRPHTPRIVEHHAGETWIGIKWDAGYDAERDLVAAENATADERRAVPR